MYGEEIATMIREQSILALGPWPTHLVLTIFGRGSRWHCGLSPARKESDVVYREGVLAIARRLQIEVAFKR
jgi:hypothetical protein